ncbi:MYG1 family protein [Lentzea sp. NEAU-D13]|uniref:MYG1 family protein n=1 Tax=Lentzea alba TaxID=2714351 RepID=A0A7C9RSY7_9PSEU|nr:MYG1 family protein [Lentzea alba]NGY62028.1 MYG1 family protein [Lentzea alba]
MTTAYADVQDPSAALNAAAEDRPGRQTTKELIEAAGWKLQGVNWIYEKVTGENLIESLISPLVGDFEKIDANANAWDQVAKALDSVRHNVGDGVGQLNPHWNGAAAQAFERRMDTMWVVAIEADSQVARIIGNKFQSMASACRSATKIALFLLDKLCTMLLEAAMTAVIPVVGWGRAVWMVYDAIQIVDAIRKIIQSIMTLIEGVKGMVDGIVAMGTALMKLKDVKDVNDFLDVVDGVQDGKQKYDNGVAAAKSGAIGVGLGAYSLGKAGTAASGRHGSGSGSGSGGGSGAPAPAPAPAPSGGQQ